MKTILRLLFHYPLSLILISGVIFLSFFKPPHVRLVEGVIGIDKAVHVLMYAIMSFVLWVEHVRDLKTGVKQFWIWTLAFVFPIFLGGAIEILQGMCTTYRGAEWIDFFADVLGTVIAAVIAKSTVYKS